MVTGRVLENDTQPLKSYALTAVKLAFQLHPVSPEFAKLATPIVVVPGGRVKYLRFAQSWKSESLI
jgi:hypothetical protein